MPRNISFSMTTQQVRDRTKDVTRRLGWENLKAGEVLNACVKCMGLKPGEKIKRICQIRVVKAHREPLGNLQNPANAHYGAEEVRREGFPHMTPAEFVTFFCEGHGCEPSETVTRIEFEYL